MPISLFWSSKQRSTRQRENATSSRVSTLVPDGALLTKNFISLAGGDSSIVHLWDTLTGKELMRLRGHKARINGLAFAPDGSSLASCSHDGAVYLWKIDD